MNRLSIFQFIQNQYHANLANITQIEQTILSYVDSLAFNNTTMIETSIFLKEFFGGAYIFIPDEGKTYQTLLDIDRNLLISRDFSSSHVSLDPQWAYNGSFIGECLFGTKEINQQKGSWIQLEAYGTSWMELPGHTAAYLNYIVSGENVGPYGQSAFTEAHPLILTTQHHLSPPTNELFTRTEIAAIEAINAPNQNPILLQEVLSQADDILVILNNESNEQIQQTPQEITNVAAAGQAIISLPHIELTAQMEVNENIL